MLDVPDTDDGLPQFERPPVAEIIGAVQLAPVAEFNLRTILRVARELDRAPARYELRDLQPQLPPIIEPPPGGGAVIQLPQLTIGNAAQPHRARYFSTDGRFVLQLQRDRIAVNERRTQEDPGIPSSTDVWPRLDAACEIFGRVTAEPRSPIRGRVLHPLLVELTYLNEITPDADVWESLADAYRVLAPVNAAIAGAFKGPPDGLAISFSYPLEEPDHSFSGRLYISAQGVTAQGAKAAVIRLTVVSRCLVADPNASLQPIFERCHRTAVEGFCAATTPEMHKIWGRIK